MNRLVALGAPEPAVERTGESKLCDWPVQVLSGLKGEEWTGAQGWGVVQILTAGVA